MTKVLNLLIPYGDEYSNDELAELFAHMLNELEMTCYSMRQKNITPADGCFVVSTDNVAVCRDGQKIAWIEDKDGAAYA